MKSIQISSPGTFVLNVTKEQIGNALVVRLSGTIDETANLEKLIGGPVPELHVVCKEVARINSVGVRTWIRYFNDLVTKKTKVVFQECSPVLVDQLSMIANFACGATIESVLVPFTCGKCKTELVGAFKCADVKKLNLNIPDMKCSKCGGVAVFDDFPNEYFRFLTR